MSSEFPSVLFLKVNVDELDDLSKHYKVKCMPTFKLFRRGNTESEYDTIEGASEDKIRNLLKNPTKSVVVSDDF